MTRVSTLHRLTAVAVLAAGVALPTMTATAPPAAAAVTYRVLITGDSITQGSSGDYTWRYRLWNKLAGTAKGKVAFVGTRTDLFDNVGNKSGSQYYAASFSAKSHSAKWGDAYADELDSIGSQVSKSKATTLVAMLGSNDLAYKTSPEATVANVKTYIQRARKARPGIDVVVGEVVNRYDPWAGTYSLNDEADAYATKLRALASSLNTSSQRVVVASTRNGWDAKKHTWDGTHPNPTGEKLIAQRVSEGLAKLGIGTASPDITGTTGWKVAGPKPSLTPASEAAKVGWTRTSTGATGMFIEQRLINTKEAWRRLPYAVAGNGWTAELLAAGGTYQYRLVPSKGSNTGVVGTAASVKTTGPVPTKVTGVKVAPGGDSDHGGKTAQASWSTAKNASGYYLSTRVLPGATKWQNLPYAIEKTNWKFDMMLPGRYTGFRIKAVRGYLTQGWSGSRIKRMRGLPGKRAYSALGDSYSSGLGAVGLDQYTSGSCRRTPKAWPWAMQHPFQAATSHVACAGATRTEVRGSQLSSMKTFFNIYSKNPHLITMTIGGNDIGFSDLARSCVLGVKSCSTREAATGQAINELEAKLRSLYQEIRATQPYADIIVGGYPVVVEPGEAGGMIDTCDTVSNGERDMIARLVHRLDTRITEAAADADVWSAATTVLSTFDGHGACTSDEWINGPKVKGAKENPNSFHPKLAGQTAYSLAFSDALIAKAGS